MSDWEEPDGYCADCGIDLDTDPQGDHDETHRLCWRCWRGETAATVPEAAGTFSVTDTRYQRVLERLRDAELRLARVEALLRSGVGG